MTTEPQPNCLFCRLAGGEGDLIWESSEAAAFRDIHPAAPCHILVVPKRHLTSLAEADESDAALLGHLLFAVSELAKREGLAENGYRVVINTRHHAGQEVDHLHLHLLGGEPLGPLRART